MYYLLIIFLKNKTFPNKIYKFHLQRLKQTPFRWKKKRKPEIWDRRKCEDSRFVENACPAFLLAPTSHFLLYQIFAFLFFGSRWKLVFKSWMGIRGLPRRLCFSLEWIYPKEDTFLLDYIKITFTYSYLMENFSLINSHNLLEKPLLFQTQITNLFFFPKLSSRWNKISCWIVRKLW